MVVTLPVVLLACAWWRRGSIGRRDVLRVLPYVLVGVLMTGMEVWTQHLVALAAPGRCDGFLSRTAVAGCAVWFYLWKVVWPADLIFVYPLWNMDPRNVLSYLPGLLLVVVFAWAWWRRRSEGRPVVMLMICYVGLLLPVLGFVNIYFMEYSLVADHWQYAAMIVPCAAFAGAAAMLGRLWHWPRTAGVALCLVVLAILGTLTWQQSRMYENSETLYRTTIARNPTCWMAYNNLGNALAGSGRVPEAIQHYQEALRLRPDYAEAHSNLGFALAGSGRTPEAVQHFQEALRLRPDFAEFHYNLGIVLAGSGRIPEAVQHFHEALRLRPDFAEAHNNLGNALAGSGRVPEAIEHYHEALRLRPDFAEAHYNLGNALADSGRIPEAVQHFQEALRLRPDFAEAHYNLGNALARSGRVPEAIEHYHEALRLKPDFAEARKNLKAAQQMLLQHP
jgi:tetratricopeptide (TPR) repeat protein